MFRNIEPLSNEKHQDLRFNQVSNFDFAKNISNVPVSAFEFVQAAKYYPVVFSKDNFLPMVLLSFEQDRNNFVNEKGIWTVPYVPAHFRRYPFIFAKAENRGDDNEEKYFLCIDRDAPHFAAPNGELMFTANGDFTTFTMNAVEFLKQYQQQMAVTANISKELQEKGLLVDRQFNFSQNGRNFSVGGFLGVDVGKLNALDDSVLADWVRRGIMAAVFAHIQSIAAFSPV